MDGVNSQSSTTPPHTWSRFLRYWTERLVGLALMLPPAQLIAIFMSGGGGGSNGSMIMM